MSLSHLVKPASAACPFCHEKAGILSREHSQYRRPYDRGFREMVKLAAETARTHRFDEKALRLSLAKIARRSHGDGNTVNHALEEGWNLAWPVLNYKCRFGWKVGIMFQRAAGPADAAGGRVK